MILASGAVRYVSVRRRAQGYAHINQQSARATPRPSGDEELVPGVNAPE